MKFYPYEKGGGGVLVMLKVGGGGTRCLGKFLSSSLRCRPY